MLPESNSLRTLNSWLVGSGYQIAQKGYYILQNEDGQFLCRRKTLAALKLELESRMAADARSSELDCLPGELRRLIKTHGLRPVASALAKACREAVAMRDHVPNGHPDLTSMYSAELLAAGDYLDSINAQCPIVAAITRRLEYLRGELQAERISTAELVELQFLAPHIEPGDVELLEAAGVPEFSPA